MLSERGYVAISIIIVVGIVMVCAILQGVDGVIAASCFTILGLVGGYYFKSTKEKLTK